MAVEIRRTTSSSGTSIRIAASRLAIPERAVQRLRLRHRPGKAVEEDRPIAEVADRVLDRGDDQVVRYEVPAIHVLSGAAAEIGTGVASLAQQVARGERLEAEPVAEPGCLGPLSGAGRAEQGDGGGHQRIIPPWRDRTPRPSTCTGSRSARVGTRCASTARSIEAIDAARRHRERCDLYHAALVVELGGDRSRSSSRPRPTRDEASRGVVATGAVGSPLGRPAAPVPLRGPLLARRVDPGSRRGGRRTAPAEPATRPRPAALLDLVAAVPTPVWGRDELRAGEGWNSNSVIAWLIATAGLWTERVHPPAGGRAPGWDAGLEVARRGPDCGISLTLTPEGSGAGRVDVPDGRGVMRRQHADRPQSTRSKEES